VTKERGIYHALFQIYRFAVRYWPMITLSLGAVAVFTAAEGAFVFLFAPFVEAFTSLLDSLGGDMETVKVSVEAEDLYPIGFKLLMLAPVLGAFALLKEYFSGWVLWRLLADIRERLCATILPQSLSFFEDHRSGDLLSRITNDVNSTRVAFDQIFVGIPQQLSHVVMGVGLALYGSWRVVLIGALTVPLIVLPIGYIARRIRRYGRQGLEKLSDLTDHMTQMFTGIRIIKAFKMEDAETQEFQRMNRKFLSKMMKIVVARGWSSAIIEFMIRATIGVAILVCVWLIASGYWRVSLEMLFVCIGGLYFAFNGLRKLVKSYNKLQESVPAADRIMEMIQHRPELVDAPHAHPLREITSSIAFNDVSFKYDNELVLRDVSFKVRVGERVAIVGKSGSGKSTLVALIMRFYEVFRGGVTFDDIDVRIVSRDSLLDRIAIVSQQTFLFNRSVAENIRYGKRDATMEEVEQAARAANIHDFILTLPEGYETLCGEFGAKLSGGQRQRIAIARAVLKDADILILDEAMVGLDSESEALVREALGNLMKGRTTFIITHDLPTIRHADRILVLRDGRLIAEGPHEELMLGCDEYRLLYGLQA